MSKHMRKEDERDTPSSYVGQHGGNVSVVQDPDDPDSVIIRTRKRVRRKSKRKKRKMGKGKKALLVVLAVILGIGIAGATAVAIAINIGNINLHKVLEDEGGSSIAKDATRSSDGGQIVEYKGHTYVYNKNIVSFVLIGHDDENMEGYEGKSLADSIALFTIDTSNNKVRCTTVPRDTWCDVDLYDENYEYASTQKMQLTLSHGVNLPTTGECAENTVRSVSRIMYNMPITYYVDFGVDVVKGATAAIGGVELQALETIPNTRIVKGETCLLDGEAAYRYITYRDIDKDDSSLDRQKRQSQFIRAFAAKVFGMGVPGILSVYNDLAESIVTNMGVSEISYLASCFVTGDNADLEVAQLQGKVKVGLEADGEEYAQYHLSKDSVMENTLTAFYTKQD